MEKYNLGNCIRVTNTRDIDAVPTTA